MKAYLFSGRGMDQDGLGAFSRTAQGNAAGCDRSGTRFGGRID
jgi:hypothetical protein